MRAIKFRAWDYEKKSMLTGNNQYGSDEPDANLKHSSAGAFTRLWESLARFAENDRFVLMQFTGLKDKNGKEIFEGDIVEFCTKWEFPQRFKGQVIYFPESMQYGFSENGESYYDFTDIENDELLEVIGNIYENPELLSPKKSEEGA